MSNRSFQRDSNWRGSNFASGDASGRHRCAPLSVVPPRGRRLLGATRDSCSIRMHDNNNCQGYLRLMLDIQVIDDPAAAALEPTRSRILSELAAPASAATLAARVGLARQKVNYHLHALEAHAPSPADRKPRPLRMRAGEAYVVSDDADSVHFAGEVIPGSRFGISRSAYTKSATHRARPSTAEEARC